MYIKNGKIKIATDIGEVPLNDLQLADHLVIFEKVLKSRYDNSLHKELDGLTSMVLSEIVSDRVYLFECSQAFSDYDIDLNLNEKTNIFEAEYVSKGMQNNTFNRAYFLNKDNTLMFLSESDRYGFDLEERNIDELDSRIIGGRQYQKVYKKLFQDDERMFDDTVCSDDHKEILMYFPIKLDDDNYLVLMTFNEIDIESRYWNFDQKVHIFNRNGTFCSLPVDYGDFVNDIKELNCYDSYGWKWLDKIDFVTRYDMKQYLNETEMQRKESLDKIYLQLRVIYPWNVEKLFSPIWENKDLDLKIYPEQIKDHGLHSNGSIVLKGKHMYANEIEDEELRKIVLREVRVANVVTEYKYDKHNNGISPFDGYLYKDGVIQEKEMISQHHHKDDEIVAISHPGYGIKRQYFVNINGYYLPANNYNAEEKKVIDDYHDRLQVMTELSKSAKMMGDVTT